MPVVVKQGSVSFRANGVYSVSDLEKTLNLMKQKESELAAARITEVFRSDYVTVFRRANGKEAVVVFDFTEALPWIWKAPDDGNEEKTRIAAETATRKSLMEGV